jgi:hypothetical protein
VRVEGETVWLNRHQLADLFGRDVKTIGKHINNALREELRSIPTVANFAIVQKEGTRMVERIVEYYNLDMIISIGYRVKSERGVLFRQWANKIIKEYLFRGYSVSQRLLSIEHRLDAHEKKIDFFVRTQNIHDRFLIVDDDVYHIGASLKDLGRKLFAFSRMSVPVEMLLPE